jgi:hypothetical protein
VAAFRGSNVGGVNRASTATPTDQSSLPWGSVVHAYGETTRTSDQPGAPQTLSGMSPTGAPQQIPSTELDLVRQMQEGDAQARQLLQPNIPSTYAPNTSLGDTFSP